MGTLHALPTAARAKVRQPAPVTRRWLAERAKASGIVVALPANHFAAPYVRQLEAEAAQRRERDDAAGLRRNAPLLVLAAILNSLSAAEQTTVLKVLNGLDRHLGDHVSAAALDFAERMCPLADEGAAE